jgi:cysteine desulfurase
VAAALDSTAGQVAFTASGTEAVNLAIFGAARRLGPRRRVVSWASEHQAVLGAVRQLELEGFPVAILPVDGDNRPDPDGIPPDAGLVSSSLANNEVGTLQPLDRIAMRAREIGALLHVDACQGLPWCPLTVRPDLVSISGHKVGAGRGGLLLLGSGVRLQPLQYGGPQERGRRAGREDVAAAAAIAAALTVCKRERQDQAERARPLAQRLAAELQELGGQPAGGDPRLPNYATATFPGLRGEDMVMALDLAGLAVSSGSACASGSLDPSHVLLAMGRSLLEANGSLRLTVGYDTTEAVVEDSIAILRHVLGGLLVATHA